MTTRQQPPSTREAQRRRTRRAIIEATRQLMAAGGPSPTVDAIAETAEVSRRTVYMHFPTLDQLLLDASLGALTEAYVDTALDDAGPVGDGDAHTRVDALVRAVLDTASTTLPLGRQIIRLTVDHEERPPGQRRGVRRVGWIEAALEPLAGQLSEEQLDRLVSGLSVLIGFEAMVVLRDVRGLDEEAELRVTSWAARALVDAILAEPQAQPRAEPERA